MQDREIINQLRSGDEQALARIYESYRNEFISWLINRYKCDVEQARDHYQFAVLKLYENVISGKLSELNSTLKTYLFAIGKNKVLESKKTATRFVDDSLVTLKQEDEIEDLKEKENKLITIEKCLEKLGDPCQSLLKQFYFYKKSMDEIATSFNYNNRDTAKNLKFKCLQRLRKLVNEEYLRVA